MKYGPEGGAINLTLDFGLENFRVMTRFGFSGFRTLLCSDVNDSATIIA